MKLQSLIKLLGIGAAISGASLLANTVDLSPTGFDGGPDETISDGLEGGEFLAVTSDNGTFITFCLEKSTYVNLNKIYSYTIDPKALAGGGNTHGVGPGDPISQGTAWLYSSFLDGTLAGSAGGTYYTDHNLNAGLLQLAFWALEDELSNPNYTNFYVELAKTHFGGAAWDNYSSSVKAMNLWDKDGGDIQSVLYRNVPDGATTSMLLGLGLLSLALFRRKM